MDKIAEIIKHYEMEILRLKHENWVLNEQVETRDKIIKELEKKHENKT